MQPAASAGRANGALTAYGVHHIANVDPDRLPRHNLVRHRAHPGQVGRRKVTAERARLLYRDPTLAIEPLVADVMRPLFAEANMILVAGEGIESRRAVNHLARRAGKPVPPHA